MKHKTNINLVPGTDALFVMTCDDCDRKEIFGYDKQGNKVHKKVNIAKDITESHNGGISEVLGNTTKMDIEYPELMNKKLADYLDNLEKG